ncbi:hypothetical protein ACQPUY_00540 [Clostridium nigeriense]|uniref:hypothetical protein n=1 Tax=Clostridium nigeriense TaxID=1805470 RepID=UPI003D338931
MFRIDNNFKDNDITYNRKLKLEEYDDNGNIIDCVEFSQKDLMEFYIFKNNGYHDIRTARKSIKDYFNVGNKELKIKLLNHIFYQYTLNNDLVNSIESIITTYNEDELNFAFSIKNYVWNECKFQLSMQDSSFFKNMSFEEVLKWIQSVNGIYYAVANDGTKGMAYLDKPTKKQAKYQRQKNGKRIVFLSFKDWKEYSISENELD